MSKLVVASANYLLDVLLESICEKLQLTSTQFTSAGSRYKAIGNWLNAPDKRSVQLWKRWRDIEFQDRNDLAPTSIILACLVSSATSRCDNDGTVHPSIRLVRLLAARPNEQATRQYREEPPVRIERCPRKHCSVKPTVDCLAARFREQKAGVACSLVGIVRTLRVNL